MNGPISAYIPFFPHNPWMYVGVMEGMMLSKRLGPKMSHNNVFSHPRDSFGSASQLHSYIIEFLRTDTCQWSLKIILGYKYIVPTTYIETDAKKSSGPEIDHFLFWFQLLHNFVKMIISRA